MKVKLRCIRSYFDVIESPKLGHDLELGHEWVVDKDRADELLKNPNNLVEVVEYIEEKKEDKKKPTKRAIKR